MGMLDIVEMDDDELDSDTGVENFTPLLPMTTLRVIGFISIFIMIILANSGGVGGGGLNVPFMVLLLTLDIKEAVPIGNFLGLIAAVIRFIINFKQRHTTRKFRLSIDYELICLTMPLNYLGTLYGCIVE